MKRDRAPTTGQMFAAGAGWWALLTFLFFLTLPIWGHALVATLAFVLDGLNNLGV